jgi:hypothetical protein
MRRKMAKLVSEMAKHGISRWIDHTRIGSDLRASDLQTKLQQSAKFVSQ